MTAIKEYFDTVIEVRATGLVILAIIFELRGFEDSYTFGLLALATLLYGYIRRVEAGPIRFEGSNEDR